MELSALACCGGGRPKSVGACVVRQWKSFCWQRIAGSPNLSRGLVVVSVVLVGCVVCRNHRVVSNGLSKVFRV